jgi:hypothetical protein
MKNTVIIFLLFPLLLTGCSKEEDLGVQIRIKNVSRYLYSSIIVSTGGGRQEYNALKSNEISDYKIYQFCYRYAFVQLKLDGKTYVLQPIDYVGETKLESGKFTYEINADVNTNLLKLIFVKD